MGGVSKCAKISSSVEKSEIWNMKSWLVPLRWNLCETVYFGIDYFIIGWKLWETLWFTTFF